MTEDLTVDETTLAQRVVLLGVTKLAHDDAVPAHSGEIVETCTAAIDAVGGDVDGRLSEADVSRALNQLEDGRLVTKVGVGETSPVGKGRPRYDLNVDVETVLDTCVDDERVATLVERIRGDA